MKTQLLSHLLIISFLFLLSCSGMEGTKGTAGARGPKGETGAKGDTGAQGPNAKVYNVSIDFLHFPESSYSPYVTQSSHELPKGSVESNDVIMVYLTDRPSQNKAGYFYPLPHIPYPTVFSNDSDDRGELWRRFDFFFHDPARTIIYFTYEVSSKLLKKLGLSHIKEMRKFTAKFKVVVIKATVGKAPTFPSSLDLGNYDAVKEHFGLD